MSCMPMFEKNLDFECVKEMVLDARSGNITVETVKKGLWVLGCGVEFFVPKVLIGDDNQEKTIEQLCDDIDASLIQSFGSEENQEEEPSKNPLIWISIASLVFQMIQFLRNRNR